MKKMNKKGFTIVELVIVIAVVAILAAVLIPTFSSVVNSANASAAQQQAKAGLDSILALTNGSLPEHTLFSVSNNDQNTASYWFEYSKNKLNSAEIKTGAEYPTYYKQEGTGGDQKNIYAVYVSADCFSDDQNVAKKAIASTSALIVDTLVRGGVVTLGTNETLSIGTSSTSGEISTFSKWEVRATVTNGYVDFVLQKGSAIENDKTLRVYYTSDIQDTMVVFIGHN